MAKKETKKHEEREEKMEKKVALKKEVKKGTKVEAKEHKDVTHGKKTIAKKIAKAHIKEGDNYYEELPKMEKKLKKGKK